jgi:hypothetical protein
MERLSVQVLVCTDPNWNSTPTLQVWDEALYTVTKVTLRDAGAAGVTE